MKGHRKVKTLTTLTANMEEEFDVSAIALADDIEFETQFMMSGEDTAILNYEIALSKAQLAALAKRTDIIAVQYSGDEQHFYDTLFNEKAIFFAKAELRSNIYCTNDDISNSTARILLETDADNPWSMCCSWEAILSDEEGKRLVQMIRDKTKEISLEQLIHYSKQASLDDIAVRNEHNGTQNITDFAFDKLSNITKANDKCTFYLDTSVKREHEVWENLRNRCLWQSNADNYNESISSVALISTVTEDNIELVLEERTSNGEQALNIPITQEEKAMLKELSLELSAKEQKSSEATGRKSRRSADIER